MVSCCSGESSPNKLSLPLFPNIKIDEKFKADYNLSFAPEMVKGGLTKVQLVVVCLCSLVNFECSQMFVYNIYNFVLGKQFLLRYPEVAMKMCRLISIYLVRYKLDIFKYFNCDRVVSLKDWLLLH